MHDREPPRRAGGQHLHRFRYFPELDAFAYFAEYEQNAWLLCLP